MSQQFVEILLVEDNLTDIKLTQRALEKYHLANHIQVVRDGVEALEFVYGTGAYAGRNVDTPLVILLDLRLPKVDGREVLERIKGDNKTKAIPVVVLTASKEERDIVDSYELGVNSYITKPVDFEQLAEVVRQLGYYWLILNEMPGK